MLSMGLGLDTAALMRRKAWQPGRLFTAGTGGAWYDPSDMTSLFQDAAGTIAVTAVGQPVARILDRSGNGLHLTQGTAANCPEYRRDTAGRAYLLSDGAGDILQAGFGGWVVPSELYWLGRSTASSGGMIAGLGIQYSATACRFGTLAAAVWVAAVPTADGRESLASAGGSLNALALRGVRGNATAIEAELNGSVTASATPAAVLGTTRSGQITLGSASYGGEFYGGLFVTRNLSSPERSKLSLWLRGKAGLA